MFENIKTWFWFRRKIEAHAFRYGLGYYLWVRFRLYYFRNGYRRIKRLLEWFPIIWHDEDWNPDGLYDIMRFKISRMRKLIRKNKTHICWGRRVMEMRICEVLLERCSKEPTEMSAIHRYPELCTCTEWKWEKTDSGQNCIVDLGICKYCSNAHKIDLKNQKDNLKMFCTYFEKHSQHWWD
jgi:hypothetical protein